MNFSNVQPKKINWGFKNKVNGPKSNDTTKSKTNDSYYTLFDTDIGVREAFQNLSWKNYENRKDIYEPSKKFKKIFNLDSETEKDKDTATAITNTTSKNNNKNDNNNNNNNNINATEAKRISNYIKLREKEIYDNSIATHASVTDPERKECIPVNDKSKNSQYKSRCSSTRSLKSLSSKSLSSFSSNSSNHIYEYKKLNDPNYLENLKYKYRNDPVGKKTLLELLRGTFVRNIGNGDENGLYFNKNNHITYSRSRRSSILSNSRRGSVVDASQNISDGVGVGSRKSSMADSSSLTRIPGVDKSLLEEEIDEYARKKGRFLNIDQMKEVLMEEKLKASKLGYGALASKSIIRKVNIVDKDTPSGNSRRKHFYKQLERMNDKYNASIYTIFNI